MPAMPAPSESALRRALVRAERGVTLDATEAETLLHARGLAEGEPLDRLLTAAGRVRGGGLASAGGRGGGPPAGAGGPPGCAHHRPEGFPPPPPSVPRPLPLLHVRDHPRTAAR